jgi:DNA helicase-2/ATP-dependent DNA helicase PcrA|tara:strand:- start:2759 stop:4252 length:1494 start_codon:yes stop_codon:yes gene_type:complete
MKTIVLGPPGTGKTETLLNEVETRLKSSDPDKIGYFAFTQKAANEAKDRAIKKFNFSEDDLPYFRTLHSLAFRQLGLRKENVMQPHHYKELGSSLKVPFSISVNNNDESGGFLNSNSPELNIINAAKHKQITTLQQYDLGEHIADVSREKVEILSNELETYKKEKHLIDFHDMISDFIKSDKCPKFDVTFIDEAQDLSKVQWSMADKVFTNTGDSFIAGDDDQAVFRWAGADVDSFIALDGKINQLIQSFRVPKSVHKLAANIVSRIKKRINKNWLPSTREGNIKWYDNFEDINLKEGKWLVLTRTNNQLLPIEDCLHTDGMYFKSKKKKNYEADLYDVAMHWEKLRNGSLLEYKKCNEIFSYMSPRVLDKMAIQGMAKEGFYSLEQLQKDFGLSTGKVWYEALDDAPWRRVEYIRSMRGNGEKLNEDPRINLSTIHGAKGGECDNVVLLTDLTRNTQKGYEKNPDDEERLFYVGATRTKQTLHIVSAQDNYKGYKI